MKRSMKRAMKRGTNRPMTWETRAGNPLFTIFVVTVVVLSHPFILGGVRLARLATFML